MCVCKHWEKRFFFHGSPKIVWERKRRKKNTDQPNFDNTKLILCCKLLYEILIKIKTKFFFRWKWNGLKFHHPTACCIFDSKFFFFARNWDASTHFSHFGLCVSQSLSFCVHTVSVRVHVWMYEFEWIDIYYLNKLCALHKIKAIQTIIWGFSNTTLPFRATDFTLCFVWIRFVSFGFISFPPSKERMGKLKSKVQSEFQESLT